MPANKNAMTRYKILDKLLSSRYHKYLKFRIYILLAK